MTKSIPIDFFAKVTPAVISAGGSGVNIMGLLLTTNVAVPIGTVAQYFTPSAVADHFGSGSPEYAFAQSYFRGYDNSPIKPAYLLVAQYPIAGVAAYLEGGALATPLATLKAITSGTITLQLNGNQVTSSSLNFSAANSYSDIAAAVQAGFAFNDATFTGVIASNVLTASSVTGALVVGQVVSGVGVGASRTILSQLTGTAGGAGTYQLSSGSDVSSEAMTSGAMTVAYDSQLDAFKFTMGTPGTADSISVASVGTIATALKLTTPTGAVVSPGSAAGVPGAEMDAIVALTQNWVTFTTLWEPDANTKTAFAAWTNGKLDRYAYCCWSTDPQDAAFPGTTGAFYQIAQANYDGTHMQYAPVNQQLAAAFIMGSCASIDFTRKNGRRNIAFLVQSGLPADVVDYNLALALQARDVSFYGLFGSASSDMFRYAIGSISGQFLWMDSYINQVWMNDALKNALANLLANAGFIPYNNAGNSKIATALLDPITAAVNFGAIQKGVTLSNEQIDEANTLAGVPIDNTLFQFGWALVIQTASPEVRAARQSPPILFFYTDGQSVQSLNVTSTEVQ